MQGSQSFHRKSVCFTAVLFLLTVVSLPGARKSSSSAGNEQRAQSAPSAARRLQVEQAYAKLPLRFEPNMGQSDPAVRYLSRGPGYALFLTEDHAEIIVARAGKRSQL